ncbi:hypothetical protein HZC30_01345 [Candidatus Woesearchaeota archaeon]|nr:hypothetical protein [Candidatus Woesearchaeota archaeon]
MCSLWTDCQYGTQSHTCTDLHACGTIIVRPALSRACEEKPSAFQQSYTPPKSDSAPPPKVAPSPTSSTPPKSTWDFGKYKPYLMGLAAFIVLAIIAVVVIFVIRKKSSGSEDYSAAENWAAKEKEAGLPEANIRAALANQGWEEEDINKILK